MVNKTAASGQSLVSSTVLYGNNGTYGSVFLNDTTPAAANNRWQFFPVDDNYYAMRTYACGPDGYLVTSSDSKGGPTVMNMGPYTKDGSAHWKFTSWNDGSGTYYLTNQANGTALHLDLVVPNNGYIEMNSNLSSAIPGQHWKLSSIAPVNNGIYSTIPPTPSSTSSSLTASATSTGPSSASATATGSTSNPNGGTPSANVTGPAVGGAIGGVFALLVLGSLAWYYLRRRGYSRVNKSPNAGDEAGHASTAHTSTSTAPEKAVEYYSVAEYRSPDDVHAYEAYRQPPPTELDSVVRHELDPTPRQKEPPAPTEEVSTTTDAPLHLPPLPDSASEK